MTTTVSAKHGVSSFLAPSFKFQNWTHFSPISLADLAQQLKDAGLEDEYDEISESVSTLQSTEDGITDFEALADVEVEAPADMVAIEDDK